MSLANRDGRESIQETTHDLKAGLRCSVGTAGDDDRSVARAARIPGAADPLCQTADETDGSCRTERGPVVVVHLVLETGITDLIEADELIEALTHPPASLKAGVLRSLKGLHLTFTGILSKPRADAQRAAKRAGAIVHSGPTTQTTVIVRGRPNPTQAAGRHGGLKLMEIKRLREKGHRITVLNEDRFWQLVARVPVSSGARVERAPSLSRRR